MLARSTSRSEASTARSRDASSRSAIARSSSRIARATTIVVSSPARSAIRRSRSWVAISRCSWKSAWAISLPGGSGWHPRNSTKANPLVLKAPFLSLRGDTPRASRRSPISCSWCSVSTRCWRNAVPSARSPAASGAARNWGSASCAMACASRRCALSCSPRNPMYGSYPAGRTGNGSGRDSALRAGRWCGAPTGLDSGEPRWRRYTARIAIDPTARNSDCQFWRVFSQKSGRPGSRPTTPAAGGGRAARRCTRSRR